MLLNLFFENIDARLELLLIGAFIFGIYWFLLRKYNSLGLRLFVVCAFLFVGCCVWLYQDETNLKNMIRSGEEYTATVLSKSKIENSNNAVEISFSTLAGNAVHATTSEYISDAEWNSFETGKPVSIIYIPHTKQTFVQESMLRFKNDKIYLWFFAGFWLVLGIILLFALRKIKVHTDENTGAEWLVNDNGKVLLDERKSPAALFAKKTNIISKLFQAFGK